MWLIALSKGISISSRGGAADSRNKVNIFTSALSSDIELIWEVDDV